MTVPKILRDLAVVQSGQRKKIARIAPLIMLLSTNLVFAQASLNQRATSGSQSNETQREQSVPRPPPLSPNPTQPHHFYGSKP
jgi:hypothetical protein